MGLKILWRKEKNETSGENLHFLWRVYMTECFSGKRVSYALSCLIYHSAEQNEDIHSHLPHMSTTRDLNSDLITTRKLFSWVGLSLISHKMRRYLFCLTKAEKNHQISIYSWTSLFSDSSYSCYSFPSVWFFLGSLRYPILAPSNLPNQATFNKIPAQISSVFQGKIPHGTEQINQKKKKDPNRVYMYYHWYCLFSHCSSLRTSIRQNLKGYKICILTMINFQLCRKIKEGMPNLIY